MVSGVTRVGRASRISSCRRDVGPVDRGGDQGQIDVRPEAMHGVGREGIELDSAPTGAWELRRGTSFGNPSNTAGVS